jgi:vacuolar protein sorting-associated protein 1
MRPTNELVEHLIRAESYFVNPTHPNFISGHKAMAIVYEKLHPKEKPAAPLVDSRTGKPLSLNQPPTPQSYTLDASQKERSEGGIFSSFLSSGGTKTIARKPGILEAPPAILKASGTVSEREYAEIEVIKMLISSYFDIVKQTCIDLVPKYIMNNLVRHAKEDLQQGMLGELYKEEILAELLKENPETVTRRNEVKRMIAALQKADEIVSTI